MSLGESENAKTSASLQGISQKPSYQQNTPDLSDRDDIKVLARVRELSLYPDGWDGLVAKVPTRKAINDAEIFARNLMRNKVVVPHISLATDGEINFFWKKGGIVVDLGFFGDGTYSYYAKGLNGEEFMEDDIPSEQKLPQSIIDLLK
jgi:hypothetical protein